MHWRMHDALLMMVMELGHLFPQDGDTCRMRSIRPLSAWAGEKMCRKNDSAKGDA